MTDPHYEIEVLDSGMADVTRNGRAFLYDADDVDEAMTKIRRKDGKGIKVTVVDETGYRETLTT